jgi:hypothetical protein
MRFDLSSDLMPLDAGRKTVDKDCAVRISERDGCYVLYFLIDGKGIIDDFIVI